MAQNNYSIVSEFILLGFTDHPELQVILFLLFLMIYMVVILGNTSIILLTTLDTHLHTPMYFFLSNLAIVDVGYSTTIAPSLLMTFVADHKAIPLPGCAMQFFFYCIFLSIDVCLLAIMAYDRFTAICSPLLYHATMSKKLCTALVLGAYLIGFVNSTTQVFLIFTLSFCRSNVINHFLCDPLPILKASCSSTQMANVVRFIFTIVIIMTSLLTIFISYICIIFAILRIRSAQGRYKAFSTCASHLTAVTLFFGTLTFMYLRPNSTVSMDEDKIVSVFYSLVIPMLNPLIYSLRNKDMKGAFIRVIGKMH